VKEEMLRIALAEADEWQLAQARLVQRSVERVLELQALVKRAAELLRSRDDMHDTPDGWYTERDQWLQDAGMEK
jgi:hypothetical protein